MNIGFVVHNHDRHEGTGGYAVELVRRIAAHHDVTLYANRLGTPAPPGVKVVHVPAVGVSAYATILSFPLGFRAVRRRHDLIHAQGWTASGADVVTAHIVVAAWRDAARRFGIPPATGERWLGGFVAARERAAVHAARAVIAPSALARDDVSVAYGRADGVHVIPHGCDRVLPQADRRAARDRFGLPPERFLALYLGDGRKGLSVAIRALQGAPAADLLVLSYSSPAQSHALAKELGVDTRLHWLPSAASAAEAYAAADALIHPTMYDTFAMPVGEALWLGLPVIVTRLAGAAELVEHRRSAWVLDGPDANGAAEALRALAGDADLREQLIRGGRAVAERYTWDETARRTLAVYEAVAA